LAAPLLVAGVTTLSEARPELRRVLGHVQRTNAASVKAFQKAGFAELPDVLTGRADSVTFAWVF
jgi:hypothetical protein